MNCEVLYRLRSHLAASFRLLLETLFAKNSWSSRVWTPGSDPATRGCCLLSCNNRNQASGTVAPVAMPSMAAVSCALVSFAGWLVETMPRVLHPTHGHSLTDQDIIIIYTDRTADDPVAASSLPPDHQHNDRESEHKPAQTSSTPNGSRLLSVRRAMKARQNDRPRSRFSSTALQPSGACSSRTHRHTDRLM